MAEPQKQTLSCEPDANLTIAKGASPPHSKCAGANIVCYNSSGFQIARTETHGSDRQSGKESPEKKQARISASSAKAPSSIDSTAARIWHSPMNNSCHPART